MATGTPNQPLGIQPIHAFREMVRVAHFSPYQLDPRTRVVDEVAFREMQDHLTRHYEGVEVMHSFEDPAGHIFDCIPIEQQPSLRGKFIELPQAPDLTPVLEGRPPEHHAPQVQAQGGEVRRDRHGNLMQAPPGTIPIRRVTLDELVRFQNLRQFFRKDSSLPHLPSVVDQKPPSLPSGDISQNHRYASTHQTVDNIGGHSSLALYAPAVNADQIFSLAQHGYHGGTGANHQTVEVGWQVFPTKYGHASSVLFIYWTADNYVSTGAYNLDAAGFVQTNSSWTIGGALSPVSVKDGQQMEIEVAVYLTGGKWWIYLGGLASANALGYYPTSLYSGGQMSSNANDIVFMGETICKSTSWPPMGSGEPAAAGWTKAAYQRNIFYFPVGGGSKKATLTPAPPFSACYTVKIGTFPDPWNVYFFYGGPGGGNC